MRVHAAAAGLLSTVLLVSGCTQSASDTPEAGAVRPLAPEAPSVAYSPVDRSALAYGLPDLVQGVRLMPSPEEVTRADEERFSRELVVRPILVERGLGPNAISIEQKGQAFDQMPSVTTSAVQIKDVPADLLTGFDPSFYLYVTSVDKDQWQWAGDKPGPERVTIDGREVWSTTWVGFRIVWYDWGDVLYVVLAENEQLLGAALRQMPWPGEAA